MSNTTITGRSPIHDHLVALGATWGAIGDYEIATHLGESGDERAKADAAGVADWSALPKVGIKGPNAIAWAKAQGIDVPDDMFGVSALAGGGIVVRAGGDELFIEANADGAGLPDVSNSEPGVFRGHRDDTTLVLMGKRINEVMAQTCGVNVARAGEEKVIYTRVAGVSCAILPQQVRGGRGYRVWVDYTFADYLWEQLTVIAGELGGGAVGSAVVL